MVLLFELELALWVAAGGLAFTAPEKILSRLLFRERRARYGDTPETAMGSSRAEQMLRFLGGFRVASVSDVVESTHGGSVPTLRAGAEAGSCRDGAERGDSRDGEAGRIARLCAGERAALGEIYDAHHAALRAFGMRLLGDPAAAEDLVHDVFVALPGALRRFRGDCALRTFLMSIAVNQARRHVRSARRRRRALERYSDLQPDARASACPEHAIGLRQSAEALREGLLALPLSQSAAFVLLEVEQLPAAEAARIMGVPEATARTRLWNARRKLRRRLEEQAR